MFRLGMLIGAACMAVALAVLYFMPPTTPPPSPESVLQSAR